MRIFILCACALLVSVSCANNTKTVQDTADQESAIVITMPDEESAQAEEPVTEPAPALTGSFDELVTGKTWELIEVQKNMEPLVIDREQLADEGFEDAYTVQFNEGLATGKGAPNTFRGPYKTSTENVLSITQPVQTRMAALKEPEALKEAEFFDLLTRMNTWSLNADGNLNLNGTDSENKEAAMIFAPVASR